MNEGRYMLRYRRWGGSTVDVATVCLGRFRSPDEAKSAAKKKYGAPGVDFLEIRQETRIEAIRHKIERFITRLLRLAFGAALAGAAMLVFPSSLSDVPLGQLTLGMIFTTLIQGALAIAFFWGAWVSAFGEGPDA